MKKLAALTILSALALLPETARAGHLAILDSTVSGSVSSAEYIELSGQGHTADFITPADWSTMTVADFAAYDALVLGDPRCATGEGPVAAAITNPDWGLAVDGNVILIGADPSYHYFAGPTGPAQTLVQNGLAFATEDEGTGITGAYVTLSCYYHFSGADTHVSWLDGFGTFGVVGGSTTGALNDVHIVASHPALAGLTDATLSNWYNTVHESFGTSAGSWPSNFDVLAVARHPSGNYTSADGTVGFPFILVRGEDVIPDYCGDGSLNDGEECDDGNNVDGDGCSAQCNLEACTDSDGDGVCDPEDLCDGDDASGDTDGDGLCDNLDACPLDVSNDEDSDGVCGNEDNCIDISNPDQSDLDGDGMGDVCDDDVDDDGIPNDEDNCVFDWNADQSDLDGDGAGDVCDADADGDDVIDADDACLPTAPGAVVDATGCSIDQLCPCDNGWKNHGAYVSCVAHAANDFVDAGLMTEPEKGAVVSAAGQSACGHKKK